MLRSNSTIITIKAVELGTVFISHLDAALWHTASKRARRAALNKLRKALAVFDIPTNQIISVSYGIDRTGDAVFVVQLHN